MQRVNRGTNMNKRGDYCFLLVLCLWNIVGAATCTQKTETSPSTSRSIQSKIPERDSLESAEKPTTNKNETGDTGCSPDFIIDKFQINYKEHSLILHSHIDNWIAALGSDFRKKCVGDWNCAYTWDNLGVYVFTGSMMEGGTEWKVRGFEIYFRELILPPEWGPVPEIERHPTSFHENCISVNGDIIDKNTSYKTLEKFREGHLPTEYFYEYGEGLHWIKYYLHIDYKKRIVEFTVY